MAPSAASDKPREETGEFTRMFRTLPPQQDTAAAPPLPAKAERAAPAPTEPGEFTRFFQGGLPPPASKTPRREPSADSGVPRSGSQQNQQPSSRESPSQERPSNFGRVQRPNTPVPGEFTRMFSSRGGGAHSSNPSAGNVPDPVRSYSNSRDYSERRAEPSLSHPGSSQQPSEYTRIFGKGNVPPPLQEPSLDMPPGGNLTDGRWARTAPHDPHPAAAPPAAKGPSEYTLAIKHPPQQDAASALSQPPQAPAFQMPQPPVDLSPKAPGAMPPVPAIHPPAPPAPKLPATPPIPAPRPAATMDPKLKLTIFFVTLGVLAVILFVLIAMIALKK